MSGAERMSEQVTILLAAYNGSEYAGAMIDSILAQDTDDWHLIVSDDGEGTAAVLDAYAEKYPEKITHYRAGKRFGSAKAHFWHLLCTFHDAPYLMFCDQDDVWHADKVRRTLEKMKETETAAGLPALVHTDLRVVDAGLGEMAPSFLRYSRLNGNSLALRQLLVQNVVTGCTVICNRALSALAVREIPAEAMLMHDWWLALLAAGCGKIGFLDAATIDYRQHGDNSVGAKNAGSLSYVEEKLRENSMRAAMFGAMRQADAFARCYQDILPQEAYHTAMAYGALCGRGKLTRLYTYAALGLWKQGFSRRVGQIIWG